MVADGGRTVGKLDRNHKIRRDLPIEDAQVQAQLRARIQRRLVPEIQKAFQFRATRIERYIVACYDSAEGGHFRAHRDNTTAGTAHRRFAVTINSMTASRAASCGSPNSARAATARRWAAPASSPARCCMRRRR